MKNWFEAKTLAVLMAVAVGVFVVGACQSTTTTSGPTQDEINAEIDFIAVACGLYDEAVTLDQWEDCTIQRWCAPEAMGTVVAGSPTQCITDILTAFGYGPEQGAA